MRLLLTRFALTLIIAASLQWAAREARAENIEGAVIGVNMYHNEASHAITGYTWIGEEAKLEFVHATQLLFQSHISIEGELKVDGASRGQPTQITVESTEGMGFVGKGSVFLRFCRIQNHSGLKLLTITQSSAPASITLDNVVFSGNNETKLVFMTRSLRNDAELLPLAEQARVTVRNCDFVDNSGAAVIETAYLECSGSLMTNNTLPLSANALFVDECTIAENQVGTLSQEGELRRTLYYLNDVAIGLDPSIRTFGEPRDIALVGVNLIHNARVFSDVDTQNNNLWILGSVRAIPFNFSSVNICGETIIGELDSNQGADLVTWDFSELYIGAGIEKADFQGEIGDDSQIVGTGVPKCCFIVNNGASYDVSMVGFGSKLGDCHVGEFGGLGNGNDSATTTVRVGTDDVPRTDTGSGANSDSDLITMLVAIVGGAIVLCALLAIAVILLVRRRKRGGGNGNGGQNSGRRSRARSSQGRGGGGGQVDSDKATDRRNRAHSSFGRGGGGGGGGRSRAGSSTTAAVRARAASRTNANVYDRIQNPLSSSTRTQTQRAKTTRGNNAYEAAGDALFGTYASAAGTNGAARDTVSPYESAQFARAANAYEAAGDVLGGGRSDFGGGGGGGGYGVARLPATSSRNQNYDEMNAPLDSRGKFTINY